MVSPESKDPPAHKVHQDPKDYPETQALRGLGAPQGLRASRALEAPPALRVLRAPKGRPEDRPASFIPPRLTHPPVP